MEDITNKLAHMANALDDRAFMPVDDPDFTQIMDLIIAEKMSNNLKSEIRSIGIPTRSEIKMVVNLFYQMQDIRKALREEIRSIEGSDKTTKKANTIILDYCLKNVTIIEAACKEVLQIVAESSEEGRWLLQIVGIGPILTAGLVANFDVTDKQYASQFISYAGLNDNNRPFIGKVGAEAIMKEVCNHRGAPTDDEVALFSAKTQWSMSYLRENGWDEKKQKWDKTKLVKAAAKIPYNKGLKTLVWKVGQSFMWCQNKPHSLYGSLYAERKAIEVGKNEAGLFAEQAANILATKNISKDTIAYKYYTQGKLPPAHIAARTARWVEKIFISHLFEEMYRVKYNKVPPRYYTLEHLEGHHKEIMPEVPYFKVAGQPDVPFYNG